ncbi:MAG: tetratricopeptide repeat protein [Ignavibacteria bacterium]|jgi:tetratricopeptide (TPR) repeat protein/glycosyltransferase involved in cell wall biosynthesis|nr:tetratricopeptide repeat protein [Ignavibacteria bacterium]MCU7502559.1 tetratricopeptide repeat protein [Ignavibacteria bacterium]MCU7515238.1 tetratricopeptide repeat protein [Ignavibacteria bacterium]
MNDRYQLAVSFFNEGRYEKAQSILNELLKSKRDRQSALFFLSVIEARTGNFQASIDLLKELLRAEPLHKEALYNLALNYQNLEDYASALDCFLKMADTYPDFMPAQLKAALLLRQLGKAEAAKSHFDTVIKNDPLLLKEYLEKFDQHVKVESQLLLENAVSFYENKEYQKAKGILLTILEADTSNLHALSLMGSVCFRLKEFNEALDAYNRLFEQNIRTDNILFNAGLCYQSLKNSQKAAELYKSALEVNPNCLEALNNLALLSSSIGKHAEAKALLEKAIGVDENYLNARINLCTVNADLNLFEITISDCESILKSAEAKEDSSIRALAYGNAGYAYFRSGNNKEAIKYFDLAIAENPLHQNAHFNKGLALMLQGDLKEGLEEYEWRKLREEWAVNRRVLKPLKKGVNLEGKTVLVFGEQGLGDVIQFSRFIPQLKKMNCRIILECEKPLWKILRHVEGIDQFVERNFSSPPGVPYDYEVFLISLLLYLDTRLEEIPAPSKISISPEYRARWSDVIEKFKGLKVGIVWAGNPKHNNDRNRSCRLKDFEELFKLEGVTFFSLQKEDRKGELPEFKSSVVDLNQYGLNDFEDTAAVISCLDLVITVDTAVAHLAGSLGKAVWILVTYVPDWRWMFDRSDSPWYPSARIFRQKSIGNWKSAFEEVRRALAEGLRREDNKTESPETKKKASEKMNSKPLFLSLATGENFGWGVVSSNLRKELGKMIAFEDIKGGGTGTLPGKVLHILRNHDFSTSNGYWGENNYGMAVFETELPKEAIKKAPDYDLVITASSWNEEKLKSYGVFNCATAIQGIDPGMFYPEVQQKKNDDLFVIFSGGKFELRKGQDIVIETVRILQQKYPDIILIDAWYNMWAQSIIPMSNSRHIKFEWADGDWPEFISHLLKINGLDMNRVFSLPLVPNEKLREIYLKTDIGLFPNRCEGGTNLVMMEYMACGKPVVASYTSGHKDVLTEESSYPLKALAEYKILEQANGLLTVWEEPSLDEVIAAVEYAYHHRDEIRQRGMRAAELMKAFTWKHTAEKIVQLLK